MTWTLVQKSAAEAAATATTVTPTLPAGSTAGNLLVATLLLANGADTWTLPAGWVQGASFANGSSHTEIWFYAANPGSISSVICTSSASANIKAALAEFHTDVAGATVVANAIGTGTGGTVTSCTATTSTPAAAGDLAVSAFDQHFVSASAITWTNPAGFTLIQSDTASAGNHLYGAYNLSVAAGTLAVTGTSSVAGDNVNAWSGAVVTFTAQVGTPPPAWSLTQKSASQGTTGSGTTVAGTLPAASAGTGTRSHLVVALLIASAAGSWTMPAGWALAESASNGGTSAAIAYLVDSAAAVGTTTTFTYSLTANLKVFLAEYNPGQDGVPIRLNASGSGLAGATAQCAVTTGTATAAGDLAVASFLEHFSAGTGVTWTTPAGWVTVGSDGASSGGNHQYAGHLLAAAAGTLTVTGQTGTASTLTYGWCGTLATFTTTAASGGGGTGTAGHVGAYLNPGTIGAGTMQQAISIWTGWTRRALTVRRIYYPFGAAIPSGPTSDMLADGVAGRKIAISFRPAFNPPSPSDLASLDTFLSACQNAGLNMAVSLWQEPYGSSQPGGANAGMTQAQEIAAWQYYAPTIRQYYPTVFNTSSYAVVHHGENNWYPGDAYIDAIATDYYCSEWTGGITLDQLSTLADGASPAKPFGLWEFNSGTGQTQAQAAAYFNYLTSWFTARLTSGKSNTDLMLYNSSGSGAATSNPIVSGGDFRLPLLDAMFDALDGVTGSGGNPPVSLASEVDTSVDLAETLTAAAAVVVTGGGGGQPPSGWPQLFVEAALQPAAPVATLGTFILDDPVYGQLNSGRIGDTSAFTDITGYVISLDTTRPSTRVQGPLLTYQAGTLSAVLDNSDGRFDPDNPASPYTARGNGLRPMIPVRVRATYGASEYFLFYGYADGWEPSLVDYEGGYAELTLNATDGFKILGGITIPAAATPAGDNDTTGARINRILTAAGWYTDHRKVAAGDTNVQATSYGDTALNLLQLTADTEIGELYCDGAGYLVFRDRHAILAETRSAIPQAVFTDLPGSGQRAWMANGGDVHTLFGTDPATTTAFFSNAASYLIGTDPTVNPVQDGLAASPVLKYTAYTQFVADVTGVSQTAGGHTFTARSINAAFQWVLYDTEDWGDITVEPQAEVDDPWTYIPLFVSLAHAHGFRCILTPGRDLGNDGTTKRPKLAGETDNDWYLRTGIPAAVAAAGADVYEVQDQANTLTDGAPPYTTFASFFATARAQARAVSASVAVWCGVSTTYGTPAQMYGAAQSVPLADGFWLNIIGDITDSDNFLILAQGLPPLPAGLPYAQVSRAIDDTTMANDVQITRAGGQLQEAADAASITKYLFPRTYARSDVILLADTEAKTYAQWVLYVSKTGEDRFEQLIIDPLADPASLFPQILGRDIGDRITIWTRPAGVAYPVTRDCFIRGIEHQVDAVAATWQTTWTLQDATRYGSFLTLDAVTNSQLDLNALAY